MMESGIKKVVLNGEVAKPKMLRQMAAAMSDPEILAEKGGYIFSFFLQSDQLHIGLAPYHLNGQRMYHYNLVLKENPHTLTGFIKQDGKMELIIKVEKGKFTGTFPPADLLAYQENYLRFARFLIEIGFQQNTELAMPTQLLLLELKLYPEQPKTIGDLAVQPLT